MRCLTRNKTIFYFDEPTGSRTAEVDTNGKKTGGYTYLRTTPVQISVYITREEKVDIIDEKFGRVRSCERRVIGVGKCPFDIDAYLYIENTVQEGHDYIVSGISQSLNSYTATIKKVV